MGKKKVLVIEDTRTVANVIYDLLRATYDVTLCFEGKQGASLAVGQPWDAIVTDLSLPGMDGMDVAKAVRQSAGNESLPLIALTGKSKEALPPNILESFSAYLIKPFGIHELPEMLELFLGEKPV